MFFSGSAGAVAVDLELSLLVDTSGSISATEFALQRDAYVNAFRNSSIQSLITSTANGRIGSIAANFIYWSSANQQVEAVSWTLIDSAAAANGFADAIAATTRPYSGGTDIGPALEFAAPLFIDNGFEGTRLVIDISGDGTSNATRTRPGRDFALETVDVINGIAIGSQSILNFYENSVIGGDGSFALLASTFEDFQDALNRKLEVEISGGGASVPLPGTLALLGIGLAGLGALRRRS